MTTHQSFSTVIKFYSLWGGYTVYRVLKTLYIRFIFDYVNCATICLILHKNLQNPLMWIKKESPDKGQIKADWELEIQLDCGALMVPTNGILDLNVDLHKKETCLAATFLPFNSLTTSVLQYTVHLWSIESSVTWVENPFLPKVIQAVLQLL